MAGINIFLCRCALPVNGGRVSFKKLLKSKSIIPVIKQPISVLHLLEVIMPPKRKNAANPTNKMEIEPETATTEIPKKRGRKAEPVEPVTGITGTEKKAAGKPEAKPSKTTKVPAKKSEEKPAEKVKAKPEEKVKAKPEEKVKAKPEEKAEKRPTRQKAVKAEENIEKPLVNKKKQGASGDKKETNKNKEEESKAKATKKTGKAPKGTKKAEDKPPLLNATETKWEEIDFDCIKQNRKGEDYNLKITSWNVDGLRAWLKKGGLSILKHDQPDILCLQETKCSDDKLPDEVKGIEGYHDYWCAGDTEGYAGVGIYTKEEPLNVKDGIDAEEHDNEGRCLTLEFTDFYLVNVYVPNAGRGLVTLEKRLEWNDVFKDYVTELDRKKPVILCGDMNVAHNEIDLANPKTNKKSAGFTQEERDGMTDFLGTRFVDSFREFYPKEKDVYTFWSYISKARSKNIGWRLDYFILSKRIMENVCDSVVRSKVHGSDHCPITLFINL